MDSTSIALPGSLISAVTVEDDTVRVSFSPAYLIKHMTGSVERTRWRQEGSLVFDGAELEEADASVSFRRSVSVAMSARTSTPIAT
jgi:hypothetical protein